MDWQIKPYIDLTLNEFHDIIALRMKIFVVEQDCPYQDLDGKDKKSYHLIGRNGMGDIVATARIMPPGLGYDDAAIGRVVVDEELRGKGLGHGIMKECIKYALVEFGKAPIMISAQKHLEKYYGQHDFVSTGNEYLEDGIPHVEMRLDQNI
ncbi:MAG: GNAT family N-acetyltransferase [Crocinitomicaceae bacterium]|nr:GNAT family N-acetyltransferase [Crocinitomicaceae bacterium]